MEGKLKKAALITFWLFGLVFTTPMSKASSQLSDSQVSTFMQAVNSTPPTKSINNNQPFAITQDQARAILQQLNLQIGVWNLDATSPNYLGTYSNALDGQFQYWKQDSVKATMLDSCNNQTRKRYGSGDWTFSFENSQQIANCDGMLVDGSTYVCNMSGSSCPYRAHVTTSYVFDVLSSNGVLKPEYVKNPQKYPAVTAFLLVISNPDAPYLTGISGSNKGYVPGLNSFGSWNANNTQCKSSNGDDEVGASIYNKHYDHAACEFVTDKGNGDGSLGSLVCKFNDNAGNCAQRVAVVPLWLQCPLTLNIDAKNRTFFCPKK